MSEDVAGLGSMGVVIDGKHLGEPGTPAALHANLGPLRAADVVQAAAKILVWMEATGRDAFGAGQRELVDALFPAEIAAGLNQALDAGGAHGGLDVVFYPGQLLTLQKLGVRVGQAGPPTSFDQGALVGRFLLAAAQVGDVRDQLVGAEAAVTDDVGGAIYGMRSAEQNLIAYPPTIAGRAFRLWLDARIPWPSTVESPDAYCQRRFGVSIHEFVAIAAAPALGRFNVDLADPGAVPFNPVAYFAETRVVEEVARRVLDQLTYRPGPDVDAVEGAATYWSFFDLADRPLVPCGDDNLVPCSLRYSLERATTGIFWMLHAAQAGAVGPLTTHFGRLFEDYCVRVAQGLSSSGTTSVCGEVEYGPASSRSKSPDVLISAASAGGSAARLFVECRAGRPSSAVFTAGSRKAFGRYIEDLADKLVQLDRGIRHHQYGLFDIPGDVAAVNDAYLPMLVVDVPFHWTFTLRNVVDDEVGRRALFRDPRVGKPIVCGIDEFESLVAACEAGADLVGLLRGYLASDRMEPLHCYVYERTGRLRPPVFTMSGWNEWHDGVCGVLFG